MGNNPSGIVTGDDAGGQCGAHSTSVESSSMVSSAPVPASRLPMPLASQESTILQVHTVPLPVRGHKVQLAVWPIFGDPVKRERAFKESY